VALNCRIYCLGCSRAAAGRNSNVNSGSRGLLGWSSPGTGYFRRDRGGGELKNRLLKERNFRGDRKTGRRRAPHVIAVNMHDVEVTLDFIDKGIESLRKDIDVMEFDGD
jgi:hypothetical protein